MWSPQESNYQIGQLTEIGPNGTKIWDTFGCGHCQTVTRAEHGQKRDDIGGRCWQCWRLLCKKCTDKIAHDGHCEPFEKHLEEQEARWRFRVAAGQPEA